MEYKLILIIQLQIVALVSKKTGISDQTKEAYQQGGIYMKLENEWKESLKQRNFAAKTIKPK